VLIWRKSTKHAPGELRKNAEKAHYHERGSPAVSHPERPSLLVVDTLDADWRLARRTHRAVQRRELTKVDWRTGNPATQSSTRMLSMLKGDCHLSRSGALAGTHTSGTELIERLTTSRARTSVKGVVAWNTRFAPRRLRTFARSGWSEPANTVTVYPPARRLCTRSWQAATQARESRCTRPRAVEPYCPAKSDEDWSRSVSPKPRAACSQRSQAFEAKKSTNRDLMACCAKSRFAGES
jgi:hypothetical protein